MRTILKLAAAFGLAVCLSPSTASAQGGRGMGGGPNGLGLLSNKSVQKELKLTEGQKTKVYNLAQAAGRTGREMFQRALAGGAGGGSPGIGGTGVPAR